jgi:TolB protein
MKKTKIMKTKNLMKAIILITVFFTMTGCEKDDNKTIINESGKPITIIEDTNEDTKGPTITVEKIEQFSNQDITDWLDEDTVIVSKENETLEKISLAELSEYYPKSLYMYNITSGEYELIKEEKEVFLLEAQLSSDKEYLLYQNASLGDPAFYILNMDTHEEFGIMGDPIGGAISASWADNEVVIGAAYSGGAYLAGRTGDISVIEGLTDEALYLIRKVEDVIYYNTLFDNTLMKFDLNTKEKVSTNLKQVNDVIFSPDGTQMLVIQINGAKKSMILSELAGENKINIVEGLEINGISWSEDQRMIAYTLKTDEKNTTGNGLYVYDTLTNESTQIAVGKEIISTRWSPTGEKLVYTELDGNQINSNIVYIDNLLAE